MLHVLAYVVVIAFPFVVFGIFLLKRAEKKIEELKMRLAVYANANKEWFKDYEELEEKLKCIELDNKDLKKSLDQSQKDYIRLRKQYDPLVEQFNEKQSVIDQLQSLLAAKDKEIEKLEDNAKKLEDRTWKLYNMINHHTIEASEKLNGMLAAAGRVYYEDLPEVVPVEAISTIKNGSSDKLQAASVGFGVDMLASGCMLSSGSCTVPYTTPKNSNIAVCSGFCTVPYDRYKTVSPMTLDSGRFSSYSVYENFIKVPITFNSFGNPTEVIITPKYRASGFISSLFSSGKEPTGVITIHNDLVTFSGLYTVPYTITPKKKED